MGGYCPGPYTYGDTVRTPDGKVGMICGYYSPPLTYDVHYEGEPELTSHEHKPMELSLVKRVAH